MGKIELRKSKRFSKAKVLGKTMIEYVGSGNASVDTFEEKPEVKDQFQST